MIKNRAVINQTRSAKELELALNAAKQRIIVLESEKADLLRQIGQGGNIPSMPTKRSMLISESADEGFISNYKRNEEDVASFKEEVNALLTFR